MNANDRLRHYHSSNVRHKHPFGFWFTEGVKALCDEFRTYWLLDVIVSHQLTLKNEEFQVWTLKKLEDSSVIIKCTDGNNKILKQQHIDFTDFKADKATLWCVNHVILLPSEY